MLKLTLFAAVTACFTLAACSDDDPAPAKRAHAHHHHRAADPDSTPPDSNPDNFQAVERPSTYSH